MLSRNDPRLRRTLNQLSQNLETANEHAQENLFTFTQTYVTPCLSSVSSCTRSCLGSCFPNPEERRRRRERGLGRNRAESNFVFYDDWEYDDETEALLGWDQPDENPRGHGVGGEGSAQQQLDRRRERGMSYGTWGSGERVGRRTALAGADEHVKTTRIPSSSYFGFLQRLPFRIGARGLKYQPSIADLQEHPRAGRREEGEGAALLDDSDMEQQAAGRRNGGRGHRRIRSNTSTSGTTTDSFSSRGDIFPSEDEADAVPIDDEFALALTRRTTVPSDENSSSRSRTYKNASTSKLSTHTTSSKSARSERRRRSNARQEGYQSPTQIQTIEDLKSEEENLERTEEETIERKRTAAKKLAIERRLATPEPESEETSQPEPHGTSDQLSALPFGNRSVPGPVSSFIIEPLQTKMADEDQNSKAESVHSATDKHQGGCSTFIPAALPNFSS